MSTSLRAIAISILAALQCCSCGKDQISNTSSEALPNWRDCASASPAPSKTENVYVSSAARGAQDGSQQHPFGSLAQARDHVRKISASTNANIDVLVEPGNYYLPNGFQLDDRDSGNRGFTVTYRGLGKPGDARLIGGLRIQRWEHVRDQVYRAKVPRGSHFTTLYDDGLRIDEARFPHRKSPALPLSHSPYLLSTGEEDSYTTLAYDPAQLPLKAAELKDARVVVWSLGAWDWFSDTVPIDHVDTAAGKIFLSRETRYAIGQKARFYVQGTAAMLGAPGEFYLDRAQSYLYYWPRQLPLEQHEVIAPQASTVVKIAGRSPSEPVHDLALEGLSIEAGDFTDWYRFGWPRAGESGEGHPYPEFDRQIDMARNRIGLVQLQNTRNVDLRFLHVRDAGFAGVYLEGANTGNCVYGNLIEHAGTSGIHLQGAYPGEGDLLRENVLSNNLIRNVGELAGHGAGIDVLNAGHNLISYSLIQGSPRYGISLHAATDVPSEALYVFNNYVHHLKILDVAQDSGDMGAVYTFGLGSTAVRKNYFDQIIVDRAITDPSSEQGVFGVYTDQNSTVQDFRNIQLLNVPDPYLTNSNNRLTSQFRNVSWLPNFDESRMDKAQIGIKPDFPYTTN